MRTVISILIGLLIPWTVIGQTVTTNIDVRATVVILTNGVQQSTANSTLNLTYSTAKDATRIDGLSWAYFIARTGGYTNSFETWIAKIWAKDNTDVTAGAKLKAENDLAARQMNDLLTVNFDLLTTTEKSQINAIRVKSPITQ